jgi:hypothetical protein
MINLSLNSVAVTLFIVDKWGLIIMKFGIVCMWGVLSIAVVSDCSAGPVYVSHFEGMGKTARDAEVRRRLGDFNWENSRAGQFLRKNLCHDTFLFKKELLIYAEIIVEDTHLGPLSEWQRYCPDLLIKWYDDHWDNVCHQYLLDMFAAAAKIEANQRFID